MGSAGITRVGSRGASAYREAHEGGEDGSDEVVGVEGVRDAAVPEVMANARELLPEDTCQTRMIETSRDGEQGW
jgi:hypothetical protein